MAYPEASRESRASEPVSEGQNVEHSIVILSYSHIKVAYKHRLQYSRL